MDARSRSVDGCFDPQAIFRDTIEIPDESNGISSDLAQLAKFVASPFMPEHGFAKDETKWYFID